MPQPVVARRALSVPSSPVAPLRRAPCTCGPTCAPTCVPIQVTFAYTTGPLAWSILTFRNSLVFHDLDKVGRRGGGGG